MHESHAGRMASMEQKHASSVQYVEWVLTWMMQRIIADPGQGELPRGDSDGHHHQT